MKKIKNKWLLICLTSLYTSILSTNTIYAQHINNPFKGHFLDKKENVHLMLDLYEPTLQIPNLEFLGKTHGYMHGNIYGIWLVTKYKINKNTATLRLSHDSGADSQTIELTIRDDSTLIYRAIDGNSVRRAHKRKLIKAPSEFKLIKID